ncbi:MAG TPA: lipase family protein [Candidatus Methylomirabilis sp.]|nr:lipase family protein [Candidatus Methylomirabilis sp.]
MNAAYDALAGKPLVTPGYDVLATMFANDLATQTSREQKIPTATVSIGLILQAQSSGEAIVAIRGTMGIREWLQDARAEIRPFTPVAGAGNTEIGFTEMYLSMTVGQGKGASPIVKSLEAIPWKQPVTSLVICGHSLGGALATLFALDAAAHAPAPFNSPVVYTYASPRAGDDGFCAKYSQLVATTFRIVDNVDVVPQLPPDPPYKHVAPRIKLDSLTLIPPRVRLQPNPICWHVMPSYLYLMSLVAGGAVLKPDTECAPSGFLKDFLRHLRKEWRSLEELTDEFSESPRTSLGGN